MSAVDVVVAPLISAEQRKQARSVGFTLVVLGIVAAFVLGNRPGDAGFKLLDSYIFVIPAQPFARILALVLIALGAAQLLKGFGKWTNVVLSIAAATFVISFLAWAASGGSFSFRRMATIVLPL